MRTATRKRTKDKRRDVAPIAPGAAIDADKIDVKDGPKMLTLPTDRHRDFVRALYQVKPGHGSGSKAARLAGFGTPTSSPASVATIASRLLHDERVQEAIAEEDQKRIRGLAPRAIGALERLVENPKHKDHARGIAMTLDRVHPAAQVVKVEHDTTPEFRETAQVMQRIAELTARFGVKLLLPPIIEGRATEALHDKA
jgi:phage terminase small subunit